MGFCFTLSQEGGSHWLVYLNGGCWWVEKDSVFPFLRQKVAIGWVFQMETSDWLKGILFYFFSRRRRLLVGASKWRLLIGWKEFCFTFALKRGGNWLVYPNGGFWLVGVPKWRLLIGWCTQMEAFDWLMYSNGGFWLAERDSVLPFFMQEAGRQAEQDGMKVEGEIWLQIYIATHAVSSVLRSSNKI